MSRRAAYFLLLLGLPMVAPSGSARCAAVEDAGKPSDPDAASGEGRPMQFRRVLASEDHMKAWPTGDGKYLPVDAAEFERLLAIVRSTETDTPRASVANATTARYEARLAGDRLVAGRGRIDVTLLGSQPALLPLEPCNLALEGASWTASSASAPDKSVSSAPSTVSEMQAILGSGPEGRLLARVERSGQLHVAWSLGGRRDASDAIHFLVELPRCPANQLTIELPDGIAPSVDVGIVSRDGSVDKNGEKTTTWNIELGGHHCVCLRLLPPGSPSPRLLLALLRESCVYDFSVRGLEVSAQWKLQAHNEPLHQVAVLLDPGMQLVTAQCGDIPLTWSIETAGEGQATEGQATRALLSLPEPIQDAERVLRLAAVTPLALNQPWRLPRMRAEGLIWQEGELSLLTPDSLVINRMSPSGCTQTGTEPLSLPRVGQSATFRCFEANAGVEIELARRDNAVQCIMASDVLLGDAETTVRATGDFGLAEGVCSVLNGIVAKDWTIDAVESIPTGAIADWEFERQRDNTGTLSIRLTKALSSAQRVRWVISASRNDLPLTQPFRATDLLPIRFCKVREIKHWVSLRAGGPTELKLGNAEQIERIDPARLPATEADLFASRPEGLLFSATDLAKGMTVSLVARKPKYSASIRAEAAVGEQTIQEGYVFRCVPESERVDRIFVRFYPQRDAAPRWTLGGESDQQLSTRRLTPEEQAAAGLDVSAEAWEIILRRPRSGAFEIKAMREVGAAGQQPLSLASLPEASHQRGLLTIRGLGGKVLQVENRRLEPIPPEPAADRVQPVQGAYRYDPVRDTASGPEAAICVIGVEEQAARRAWIWSTEVESWYGASGSVRHRAACNIQNMGCESLRLGLPTGACLQDIRGVWVDGVEATWSRTDQEDGLELQIGLPAARRFPTVAIEWTASRGGLGLWGALEPPRLDARIPVLASRWTAWLPPDYRVAASRPDGETSCPVEWTWKQRLFGPLSREPGQLRFNPFSAADWFATAKACAAANEDMAIAEPFLEAMGNAAAANKDGDNDSQRNPRTWGGMLAIDRVPSLHAELLVDHRSLTAIGLTPATQFRPALGDSARSRGERALQEANLALWISGNVLTLTTQAETALHHNDLATTSELPVRRVLPGRLATRLRQAAEGAVDDVWIPAETWRRRSPEPRSPWLAAGLAKNQVADAQGWIANRVELSASPISLGYVHRDSIRLFACIAFLLAVAAGWWKLVDHPLLTVLLVGVFAVGTMLLPPLLTPVPSAAIGGTLLCAALHRFRRRPPAAISTEVVERSAAAGSTTPQGVPLTIFVLALGIGMLRCVHASGEQPLPPPTFGPAPAAASPQALVQSPGPSPIYRVFVPIDAERKPVGDKVYLPEPFYQELYRRTAATTEEKPTWLVLSALYRGALGRESGSGRIVAESLKAQYDLQVFAGATRVRIPIHAEGVNLLPNGVTLDGRVIQPEWEPNAAALLVDVAEPGACRLEIALRPTSRSSGKPAGFDFEIPRVAGSRLELSLPDDAPVIEVPAACGTVRLEQNPPRLSANLGPANRLTVLWREGATAAVAAPTAHVEQLTWLRVSPGSVVIQAKFKFRAIEGQIQRIQLVADQRLRLLPMTGSDPPIVTVRPGPRQTKLFSLRWLRSVPEELAFEAAFLLTETSGVGNFRLPELTVTDTRAASEPPSQDPTRLTAARTSVASQSLEQNAVFSVGQRWLAVTVDSSLDRAEHFTEGIEAATTAEFVKAWGGTDVKPQSAYRLVAADNDWSLSTHPHEAATAADESLALSFDRDEATLAFTAQLATTAGYVFQHRLAGPIGLQIDRVSLIEENVERVRRWAQDPDGSITVFLTGPVSGQQKFSLDGHISIASNEPWSVPRIHVERSVLRSTAVQLFRRSAVQLTWQSRDRSARSQSLADAMRPEFGRFVIGYRLEEPRWPEISVTVQPNDPQVHAQQVLSLRGSGRSWSARLDCSIQVRGGMLDRLCIQAPSPWNGPYSVSVPGTLDVVETAGEGRQLLFRPRLPMMGSQKFSISGPLELARGDRPNAPNVILRNIDDLKRWVALPDQSKNLPLIWQTRGLRRCEKTNRPPTPIDPDSSAYAVVGEPTQAILPPSESPQGEQFVRLADISIAWLTDGTCEGIALFDLEPGGATECPLRLPPGHDLVQVLIDGASASPRAIGDGTWRVPLSSKRLPQRVEVLFRGQMALPDPKGKQTLQAPMLGDAPVRQTMWTIAGPRAFSPGIPRDIAALPAWQQQWLRVKEIAAVSQSAFEASADNSDEVSRWYPIWMRRLTVARAAMLREIAVSGGNASQTLQKECKAIDDEQALLAERLDAEETYKQLSVATMPDDSPMELWARNIEDLASPTRCSQAGGADGITLDYRSATDQSLPHWTVALALAISAVLIAILWTRGLAPQFLQSWPRLCLAAVGIGWWWWLWPSVLGLLIILGSLLATLRRFVLPSR